MPEDMQNLPEPETVQTEPETELQEINTNPVSVDYTDTLNTIDSNLVKFLPGLPNSVYNKYQIRKSNLKLLY